MHRVFIGAVSVSLFACSSSNNGPTNASDAAANDDTSTHLDAGPDTSASDMLAAERLACTFSAGAKVADTLGLTASERQAIPIKNIIVVMKENRSFDHLLGKISDLQPAAEALPATATNPDPMDASVPLTHATSTCLGWDPTHQWDNIHAAVDNGKMDGFVLNAALHSTPASADGHFVMTYYDQTDLPFDYFLANTFALNDRHFASVRSGTFPNRNFLLLGTADGVASTGEGYPDPSTPTIMDLLDKVGVTWGVYSDSLLFSGTLNWAPSHVGAHTFAEFLTAVDAGTLPQVAFVDGVDSVSDDHPLADLQAGEVWTKSVYDHATASKLWPNLALIWTYDEGGAFYDHVPPPNSACVARPENATDVPFFELGPRIPLVMISPWARAHFVSHVVEEHTAITRFIEAVFDIPALTARDANSTALLDLFDFSGTAPFASPPVSPAAGTGGCK